MADDSRGAAVAMKWADDLQWYYDTNVWKTQSYRGVRTLMSHAVLHPLVAAHPRVRLVLGESAAPETVATIRRSIPADRTGGMLLILDSDHRANHVLRELEVLVPLLKPGNYLIVEDTVVNGHPVRQDFGPGPLEAVEEYLRRYPDRLIPDSAREAKFGCTFAYRGYYKVPLR